MDLLKLLLCGVLCARCLRLSLSRHTDWNPFKPTKANMPLHLLLFTNSDVVTLCTASEVLCDWLIQLLVTCVPMDVESDQSEKR